MALKDEMPKTAAFVAERRREFGGDHANAMVRAAMAGQPDCLWCVELVAPGHYRTFGAPMPSMAAAKNELLGQCMMLGAEFFGWMAYPAGWPDRAAVAANGGV